MTTNPKERNKTCNTLARLKTRTRRQLYKTKKLKNPAIEKMKEKITRNTAKRTDSEAQSSFKETNSLIMRHCCLFSFIFLSFLLLSLSVLFIALILKPKKPTFKLHSIHFDRIELDTSSATEVFLQPLMASLLFVTQNFNRFGIRYSPSSFGVIYEGNPVGVVEVPGFYQPPNATDVALIVHVLLERVNISRFMDAETEKNGGKSSNMTRIEVGISGVVRARIHVDNFSFPMMKVNLGCSIKLDNGAETFSKSVMFMKTHKALVLSKFPHLYQHCSVALCL